LTKLVGHNIEKISLCPLWIATQSPEASRLPTDHADNLSRNLSDFCATVDSEAST